MPPFSWNEERTKQLIKEYEWHDVLWNPDHRAHMHRNARSEAWKALADEMQISVREVKNKINSLTGVFRSQQRRGVANQRWWARHMSFLLHVGKADEATEQTLVKNNETSDNIAGDDQNNSDQEFRPEGCRKRPYLSAFQEFRAEFEPVKEQNGSHDTDLNNQESIATEEVIVEEIPAEPEPEPEPPTSRSNEDEDDDIRIYVKYFESKLKTYSAYTRNAIHFKINRILYEADMGLLDKTDAN